MKTPELDKQMRVLAEAMTKDVSESIKRALEESHKYGSGYLQMHADGSVRHVPFKELCATIDQLKARLK
jgi:hypothetical protein